MQPRNMMEVVKKYATESNAIMHYVPNANFEEIYLICGLKNFLKSTTDIGATAAIIDGNNYFKSAVGFQPSKCLFDAAKLDKLIKDVSLAAIKQKQMSAEELLAQMEKYEELARKLNAEKSNQKTQIDILMNVLKGALQEGINSASFTAKETKAKFRAAIDLMGDDVFKKLDGTEQATALNDVIIVGDDIGEVLRRRIINQNKDVER